MRPGPGHDTRRVSLLGVVKDGARLSSRADPDDVARDSAQERGSERERRDPGFRARSLAMAITLLVVLACLSFAALIGDARHVRGLHAARQLVQVAVRVSSLVHELQRERGMSSGFLASRGRKFDRELAAERVLTDRQVLELRAARVSAALDATAVAAYDVAIARLAEVGAFRARISEMAMPPKESFDYYTGIIDALLEVVEGIARDAWRGLSRPYDDSRTGEAACGRWRTCISGSTRRSISCGTISIARRPWSASTERCRSSSAFLRN